MQHPSKSLFTLSTSGVLAAALLAMPMHAQEPSSGVRPTTPETRRPGGQDKQQPQDGDAKILGQNAVLGAQVTNGKAGGDAIEHGEIADLVIDARTGDVRYAILAVSADSAAGKQTAIPWGRLKQGDEEGFVLSMRPDELANLPAFEPKKLQMLGRGAADASSLAKARGGATGGSAGAGKPAEASTEAAGKLKLLMASWIGDCDVRARTDKLGSDAGIMIDAKHGRLAYVTVPVEGERAPLVVPWQAIQVREGMGNKHTLVLSKSKDELAEAPRLAGEHANLTDADVCKAIHEFYGVEVPKAGGKSDAAGTKGGRKDGYGGR